MIPTSAVRETLILILFGIILVPIAAKRAQDARGYWQTFQLQELATTLPSDHAGPLVLAAPIIQNNDDNNNNYHHNNNAMAMVQNETSLPAVPAAAAVYATSSAPRAETARTSLTIRFGSATTAAAGSQAIATVAPRLPLERQQLQPQPQKQQLKQTVQQSKTQEQLPAATKMSDASKGRWTLIWMGSAIAAVAVFMSLC